MQSQTLYLTEREFADVLDILSEVRRSVNSKIAIGGSLAQRALDPEFASSIADKPLSDIDIVLVGGSFEDCVVSPEIKKYFFVTQIYPMFGGYHFNMIHKKTNRWVDLFSEPYEKKYESVTIAREQYLATTIESQILHLAQDALSLIKRKTQLREKWAQKLVTLWSLRHIDMQGIEQEFSDHKEHFMSVVPQDQHFDNASEYIKYAIAQGQKYATPYIWKEKIDYPTDCVITSNGIRIDSPLTYRYLCATMVFASLRYGVLEPPVSASKPRLARNDGAEAPRNPLVTCLMITRGVIPILRHSAECFRRQSYANRELVVVSEHDAHNNVQEFFRSHDYNNVKFVRVPSGIPLGNLRNIGISYSSGDIIAVWDDDDLYDPDRLKDGVDVLLDCGRAAAAILSQLLIWWPARKLLFISERRGWEASMISWRSTIPIYPALEKREDTSVLRHMHHNHPLALIEKPSLYVYTVTGRNTWDQGHFEMFLSKAKAVFRDQEYDRALEHLQNRVPIREYEKDIRSVAMA